MTVPPASRKTNNPTKRRGLIANMLANAAPIAPSDLLEAILGGLPSLELKPLLAMGFTTEELAEVIDASRRTLTRRLAARAALTTGEGDRLVRFASIVAQARKEAFESDEQTVHWFRSLIAALGSKRPLDLVRAEPGADAVRRGLGVIAYGGVT